MTLMKKILGVTGIALTSTTFLAVCSSSLSSSSSSSGKEEVIFAAVETTAPSSYEKDGELIGYDIEITKAVFKDSDKYEVTFKKTERSSIFTGLNSGRYQMGGNNISYAEGRSVKYLFSYPIGSTPSVLVVPDDSDMTSYDDIGGHSTQVVQGTTTAVQLEEYNEENANNTVDIDYTNENITQILTDLNDGKYDFKIFDAPAVSSVIKNQSLDSLKTVNLESEEQPYIYFIFGQDQEDLQEFVDKRLKELQEDGTLTELAEKYLGGDYTPSADYLRVPASD